MFLNVLILFIYLHILQKLFHINDPTGSRKKNFVRALAARFRQLKSRLVDRFITKKSAPPPGNPNANKKPWQVYDGYITEEQWKLFEAYVESDEFKVINNLINIAIIDI